MVNHHNQSVPPAELPRGEGFSGSPGVERPEPAGSEKRIPVSFTDNEVVAEEDPVEKGEPQLSGLYGDKYEPVEKIDKAHDMALAEDEDRTFAAKKRAAANLIKNFQDDIDNLPSKGSSRFSAETRARNKKKRELEYAYWEKIYGFDPAESHDVYDVETALTEANSNDSETRQYHQEVAKNMELDAQEADERATALGEWAGNLYDNPVGESYKTEHPEIDFTPAGLVVLEKQITEYLNLAAVAREQIGKFDSQDSIDSMLPVAKAIRQLISGNPEAYKAAHEAVEPNARNALTTWAALYNELQAGESKRLRTEAIKRIAVIKDIKEGRAKDSDAQESETSNPELAGASV